MECNIDGATISLTGVLTTHQINCDLAVPLFSWFAVDSTQVPEGQ